MADLNHFEEKMDHFLRGDMSQSEAEAFRPIFGIRSFNEIGIRNE